MLIGNKPSSRSNKKLTYITRFESPPLCFAAVLKSESVDFSPLRGSISHNQYFVPMDIDQLLVDDWQGGLVTIEGIGFVERNGRCLMILAIDNKHEADTEISAAALRALLNLRSKINGVHILYHDRVQTPSGALLFNPTHMQEVIPGGLSDKKRITTDEYIERYFKPFHDGK